MEMQQSVPPAGLRLPDASRYVGVSPAMLKKLVREERVRSVTIGRTRIFPRTALDELLAARAA